MIEEENIEKIVVSNNIAEKVNKAREKLEEDIKLVKETTVPIKWNSFLL